MAVSPRAFVPLVGLTALGILVQGVLAGVFLQTDGERDVRSGWIDAHGVGADVVSVLALLTAVVATVSLRSRRSLVVGSWALFVLLLVESLLGHLVNGSIGGSDHDALTVVHVPLAMLLLGVTVWLSTRAATLRRAGGI